MIDNILIQFIFLHIIFFHHESIKLTVAQLKEDGTIRKELLYQVSADVENVFEPSGDLMNYSITYSVRDSAGNMAEKKFDFTATADTEKTVI